MFAGENAGEILAKVIRDEPDLSDAPAEWRPLLKRCLEKDPKRRLRDIGDMELLVGQAEGPPIPRGGGRRQWIWTALTAVLLVAFAALSFVHDRETLEPALRANDRHAGRNHGFSGLRRLPRRPLPRHGSGGPQNTPVYGSGRWIRNGLSPCQGTKDALQPFWSPDSRDIAFFANGKLKKVALSGGPAQSLCDVANPHGGSWSDDGVIVFFQTPLVFPSAGSRRLAALRSARPGSKATWGLPYFYLAAIASCTSHAERRPTTAAFFSARSMARRTGAFFRMYPAWCSRRLCSVSVSATFCLFTTTR